MPQRSALLLVFLFILLSASAPLHPRTESEPPRETTGWRAQPTGRGTFQIILSCVLTLGLCVWTSIHQNVKGELGYMDHFKHKYNMAMMALVMPEKIVSKAWDEWKQARELHRALIYESWVKKSDFEKAMREEQEKNPSDRQADVQVEQRKWWDRVQDRLEGQLKAMGLWIDEDAFPKEVAFFVIMKGFVWSKNGEVVPVTASEFFHAFKEGKIAPIKRKPKHGTGTDRKNDNTAITTRTGAIWANVSPVAGPDDGKNNMIDKITGSTTVTVARKDVIGIKINDVLDKGKSSVLSKLIICGQVGWMVLQLIGRQVLRLPMTLIELHTLIHIGIAVIRFWLWWYKPLDVGEPIVLDMEFIKEEDREWSVRPERFKSQGIGCFIDYLWLLPAVETRDSSAESGTPSDGVDSTLKSTINSNSINSGTPPDGATVAGTAEEKNQVPRKHTDPQPVAQLSLWGWLRKPFRVSPLLNPPKKPSTTPNDTAAISIQSKRLRIWKEQSAQIVRDNTFPCTFYFVYGGLHAVVWSEYFSTRAEQWLWRGACLVVGIAPSLVVYSVILFGLIDRSPRGSLNRIQVWIGWAVYIIYLVASIGLVIEAFVSLRRLPFEAYQSVPWTAYIPHF